MSAEQARTIVHWIQSGLVAGLKKSTRQRQNTILTERPVRLFGSKAVRIVIGLFNDRLNFFSGVLIRQITLRRIFSQHILNRLTFKRFAHFINRWKKLRNQILWPMKGWFVKNRTNDRRLNYFAIRVIILKLHALVFVCTHWL